MKGKQHSIVLLFVLSIGACKNTKISRSATGEPVAAETIRLPAPFATPSVRNVPKVIGWPQGKTPIAPEGFAVTKFAEGLDNPRWIYVAPNGDIFIAMANTISDGFTKTASDKKPGKSSNTILLLRDKDGDGIPEVKNVFLKGLNRPLGMLILNGKFYVGNTNGLWMYPYEEGQTEMTAEGTKILDLPAGGYNNHWTRNVIANAAGTKLYVSVGSGSNVAEHGIDNEKRRANILEINPDGSGERIYASGLRNPVGMDWATGTNTLWTAVNERDNLGDDLVPDYATSVKENGFYGWPYAYYGKNADPRMNGERMDLVNTTITPDVSMGSHTASLGLVFNKKDYLTTPYFGGMFVGQHGSWNRSLLSGYKVVFVPFSNGKPSGPVQDFLTGFITSQGSNDVYGRPVGVAFTNDGALLVADDAGKTIWRVIKK
ncbi:PQQ-dependent sugar dehydrogenase [Ferruginibacter sp. SUN106]|uniref:PQQ-dependent sugar dehydrogenase n=1 Tax=Ferruginibacter sp. SUN106 TaxID=2978348 RepID=UPI003D363D7A